MSETAGGGISGVRTKGWKGEGGKKFCP